MNMDKLDAAGIAVRDLVREHGYVKTIEIRCVSDERGLTTETVVHHKDGVIVRIVRSGEAPF